MKPRSWKVVPGAQRNHAEGNGSGHGDRSSHRRAYSEIFGGVALFLATIGLYGVNAYTVARRTREIGIRTASGDDAPTMLRMILGEGFRITAVAVGLGLLLAPGIGQVLTGFLYEVRGIEPAVLLVAAAILAAVALVACCIPARKASLVDPMMALRYE